MIYPEKKPLLTVAIPTYNRSRTLEKILTELRSQASDDFVVLVSDDASPDNTGEMVKTFQQTMPNLVYHRNEQNLGFSGNVCKIYEIAETRYVWFLCDDDTVLEGAVKGMIESLRNYEPTVAVYNCFWVNPLGQKLMAGPEKDIVYDDIEKMKDYQPLMRTTFLSILVVEKSLGAEEIKKTNYKDNIFFQVSLSLYLLSAKFHFCEIALPVLQRNVGYKYGEFFKFYLIDQLKAVFAIKHCFDNKKFVRWAKKRLPEALLLYLSQKLGLFKYNGRPTFDTVKKVIKYYGISSIFVFLFPVIYFLTPRPLADFFYKQKLAKIHGKEKAETVYKQNIDRVLQDERKTKFTTYR